MTTTAAQAESVAACEQERIRALIARDLPALETLLDPSLVHVHTTGKTEDHASYMDGVANNLEFFEIERGDLTIRVFGDVAVMTGPLRQRLRIVSADKEMEMSSMATQVWLRSAQAWKLASFHACNI